MEQSQQIGSLAAALAKAQLEITNPEFDAINPHYKNKYASLAAHTEALRKPLAKQGLTIVQSISTSDAGVCVTTRLIHSSGEWLADGVAMPMPEKATAQTLGSFVTYLRRYSLAAFGLVVGEPDDDGEEDRKSRGTTATPAVLATKTKPSNANDSDFLAEANSTNKGRDLIGADRAREIVAFLTSINRTPEALLETIQAQGFDVSKGIAGLPASIHPRVQAWITKAASSQQPSATQIAHEGDEKYGADKNLQPPDDKPSRLDSLRIRRSSNVR